MGEYQDKIKKLYKERGYTDDLPTLGLGLCEEAGEVAKAINQMNPKYKMDGDKIPYMLREELHDCLSYICAIANASGIKLGI